MLTGGTTTSPTVMVVDENDNGQFDGKSIMNSVVSSLSFRKWMVIQFLMSVAQCSSLKMALSSSPGTCGEKAKYNWLSSA